MHITHLETDNFKSFGRKTKIPLFPGFTVISGPNGSGKSNIIDSILFVLALSSSRSLRAERLTDLINLNSGKNTAEVELTFSDGTVIKRRIKRTDSTYYNYLYLNGRPCRQGDLLEFLAQRGIVPHGYNVVMQGDINRIIEMSDLERRKIIDEIAGVAEFDQKKALAFVELDRVRNNIQEQNAHLEELTLRLSHLEKQRVQALKYRSLHDRLKYLTSCRSAARLAAKQKELETLQDSTREEEKALAQTDADISWTTHERDFVKNEIAGVDHEISAKTGSEYMTLISRIAEAKAAIEGFKRDIERQQREKDENDKRLGSIYGETKRQDERLTLKNNEIRDLTIDRTNLAMTLASAKSESGRIEKEIQKQTAEHEQDEQALQVLRKNMITKKDQRSDLLREQDIMIERSRMRSAEEDRLRSRVALLQRDLASGKVTEEEASKNLEALETEKLEYDRRVGLLDTNLYSKRDEQERLRKEIRDLKIEINRKEAQQQAQGRYGKAIEAVLAMDGVYGTIASLARCKPEYATALNTAAGARLHFVVVENDQIASDAIQFLKDNNLGRVTFLPLNKLRPKPLPEPPHGSEIIGFATDLLDYDPRFDPAFRVVFAGTVVVDSLEHARKRIGSFRMVTLDGSLLEKSGSMTGGSIRKEAGGFGSSFEDELRRLYGDLAKMSDEEAALDDALTVASAERDEVQKRRMDLEGLVARSRAGVEVAIRSRTSMEEEIKSLEDQIAAAIAAAPGGPEDLAVLEGKIRSISQEISSMQGEIDGITSRLEGTGVPALFEQMDQASRQVEEVERRLRNKENDIAEAQRERGYIERTIAEQKQQMDQIREQSQRYDAGMLESHASITGKEQEIKETEMILSRFSRDIEDLQVKRNALVSQVDDFESKIRELTGKRERIAVKIESLEQKGKELSEEIASLTEEAAGVTTEMALEAIEEEMGTVALELDRIGDVNMRAIEEYEQVNAIATERKERLEVLGKELEEISARIELFSQKKLEAFNQAFSEIARNFREIFARLTVGSGELKLENEEDPFVGGLSFAVQPRDKKVHHLAALSGGEKSLTTLAFIFSIQKYIPAPFYAFDEVDMNLDGANVERIADLIKELSENSQFINISLRKPMIDSADRIIGVTIRPDKSTLVTGVSIHD
ncbi:chromosome segregation protein SMC [Methanospirillum lacunae]|uniref:Chromosome partition protein Smc n=1 Tax=Methanospirillum lacunae TaxID=668570 RepID=A0A2V2N022_9EURY|nr:chromosome segregation protein SMC [Methanospirillum lacunae]PWR71925.1 chromosome segregation protein SMC [Methanospirillum lacunae]